MLINTIVYTLNCVDNTAMNRYNVADFDFLLFFLLLKSYFIINEIEIIKNKKYIVRD